MLSKCYNYILHERVEASLVQEYFIIIFSVFLSFICFTDNIKSIKSSAKCGFYSILLIIILVGIYVLKESFFQRYHRNNTYVYNLFSLKTDLTDFNNAIAIIILSFSFHTYTFSIYECLEEKTTENMMVSTRLGLIISTLSYLFVGSTLYLIYGKEIMTYASNFTDLLNQSTIGILINICYGFLVLMTFPISFYSVKNYIFYIVPYFKDFIKSIYIKTKRLLICKKKSNKYDRIIDEYNNEENKDNNKDDDSLSSYSSEDSLDENENYEKNNRNSYDDIESSINKTNNIFDDYTLSIKSNNMLSNYNNSNNVMPVIKSDRKKSIYSNRYKSKRSRQSFFSYALSQKIENVIEETIDDDEKTGSEDGNKDKENIDKNVNKNEILQFSNNSNNNKNPGINSELNVTAAKIQTSNSKSNEVRDNNKRKSSIITKYILNNSIEIIEEEECNNNSNKNSNKHVNSIEEMKNEENKIPLQRLIETISTENKNINTNNHSHSHIKHNKHSNHSHSEINSIEKFIISVLLFALIIYICVSFKNLKYVSLYYY